MLHFPKSNRFSAIQYSMKCCGENVILRGIFHVVSRFPLHFMFNRGNLDYFSNSVWRCVFPDHLLLVYILFPVMYITHLCYITTVWQCWLTDKNKLFVFIVFSAAEQKQTVCIYCFFCSWTKTNCLYLLFFCSWTKSSICDLIKLTTKRICNFKNLTKIRIWVLTRR